MRMTRRVLMVLVFATVIVEGLNLGLSLLNVSDDLAVIAGIGLIVLAISVPMASLSWLSVKGWL